VENIYVRGHFVVRTHSQTRPTVLPRALDH